MTKSLRSVSTPWTDILAAQRNPALRPACLEMLAAKYHTPVHAYIQRALHVHEPEVAEDLAQGYFLRFLERNDFDRLDRERGRLRSFLTTAVRNYVNDERDKKATRNPASPFFTLSSHQDVGTNFPDNASPTPEDLFNREWARGLFADAKEAFRCYCNDKGKQHYWAVFERYLSEDVDKLGYERIAAELGISAKDVANHLLRSKKKFQAILQEVIRATVATDEAATEEARDLLRYFHP